MRPRLPITEPEVRRLHAAGMTVSEAASALGVTPLQLREWTYDHTEIRFRKLKKDQRVSGRHPGAERRPSPQRIAERRAEIHAKLMTPIGCHRLADLLEGDADAARWNGGAGA